MRLIDADALLEEIKDYKMDIVSKATVMRVIRKAPTVDAFLVIPHKRRIRKDNIRNE